MPATRLPNPDDYARELIDVAETALDPDEELEDVLSGFSDQRPGGYAEHLGMMFALTSRRLLIFKKKVSVSILKNLLREPDPWEFDSAIPLDAIEGVVRSKRGLTTSLKVIGSPASFHLTNCKPSSQKRFEETLVHHGFEVHETQSG